MNGEGQPRYLACDCDLTLKHILIECGDFPEVRQRYCDAENLRRQFQENILTNVFDFL